MVFGVVLALAAVLVGLLMFRALQRRGILNRDRLMRDHIQRNSPGQEQD